jgi:hypothetical protein
VLQPAGKRLAPAFPIDCIHFPQGSSRGSRPAIFRQDSAHEFGFARPACTSRIDNKSHVVPLFEHLPKNRPPALFRGKRRCEPQHAVVRDWEAIRRPACKFHRGRCGLSDQHESSSGRPNFETSNQSSFKENGELWSVQSEVPLELLSESLLARPSGFGIIRSGRMEPLLNSHAAQCTR